MSKKNNKQNKYVQTKVVESSDAADFKFMIFKEPKFYNGEILYKENVVVKVPNEMVDRWLRRGGVLVDADHVPEVKEPEKVEDSDKKDDDQGSEPKDVPSFKDPAGEDFDLED